MNPVIGLDIAKGESQCQAFLDKGKHYGKGFTIIHTREGLHIFHQLLKDVEAMTGQQPMVILEATGHYYAPVTEFLDEQSYLYIVVNPILAYQAKKSSSLRKVKTDAIDAYALCEFFYKEDFEPHKTRGVQLVNLRNLTRQHESLTGQFVQIKLQFQAILDQVFPEFKGVYGDLYSAVSLQTLLEFPTSEAVLSAGEAKLTERIAVLCARRSERWAREKVQNLIAVATRNPFRKALYQSHLFSMHMYINMLLHYKEHLSTLKKQIDALANEVEEYEIIQSIPVSEKKSLQRLFRKSVRSIGLMTLRSSLPSLA